MSKAVINLDSIENTVRQQEFTERVARAANAHLRITEPTWDLYDVKVKTDSHAIEGSRIAVTLFFRDNLLGILK